MHGGFLKIFLILLISSLLLDWYVFSGIVTLSGKWASKRARQISRWGFLVLDFGITILLLAGLSGFRRARGMTPYHEWILSLFLTLLVTKLFFSLVLLLGDIACLAVDFIRWISRRPEQAGSPASVGNSGSFVSNRGRFSPSRRRFVSEAAVLVAAIPFSGFLYGMLRGKYDYKVHRVTIAFPDLPEAFDGFTITQLSDIHSGSFDHTAAVQRGIDLAQSQKSDLFVFTGDLVNNAAWEIEPYLARFSQLKAPYGQFSILGNHDYGDYIQWDSEQEKSDNLEQLKKHHATLGYRLLLDENIVLEKGGEQISLIGVQNWGKGFIQKGDLDKALMGVDKSAFKICLSHDPSHWEEKIRQHPETIHLTLSGHTHGAQFGVESDKLRWSPVQYRYKDWAGLANEGSRYLYVNRGFGFLAFSGRLGIWPEITVITLKKERAGA